MKHSSWERNRKHVLCSCLLRVHKRLSVMAPATRTIELTHELTCGTITEYLIGVHRKHMSWPRCVFQALLRCRMPWIRLLVQGTMCFFAAQGGRRDKCGAGLVALPKTVRAQALPGNGAGSIAAACPGRAAAPHRSCALARQASAFVPVLPPFRRASAPCARVAATL